MSGSLSKHVLISIKVDILVKISEVTQYTHKPKYDLIKDLPIITRDDLRKIVMEKGEYTCRTSGSTGEPVSIEKTISDRVWTHAMNIRDYRWRGWDPTKNIALIKPNVEIKDINSWGIPSIIEPKQGCTYKINYRPIKELQAWIEMKNPHYLVCAPSIRDSLDLSKVSNYIGWRGTGEIGGTTYSSEECGIISIQCPDNPACHHVMENQIVEVDDDGGLIISTMTNNYIRRYKHGDHIELGECSCGRTLQAIKKIHGRKRNMFTMANGDKRWPLFGSLMFYEKFGIRRFRIVQTAIGTVEALLLYEGELDRDQLVRDIRSYLEEDVNVIIKRVHEFVDYKHEEFTSLV